MSGFLQPQYVQGRFAEIEDKSSELDDGVYAETRLIPEEYVTSDQIVIDFHEGYFWHLSASGYLDQTDWSGPFKSLASARADCRDTFEDICYICGDNLTDRGYCRECGVPRIR